MDSSLWSIEEHGESVTYVDEMGNEQTEHLAPMPPPSLVEKGMSSARRLDDLIGGERWREKNGDIESTEVFDDTVVRAVDQFSQMASTRVTPQLQLNRTGVQEEAQHEVQLATRSSLYQGYNPNHGTREPRTRLPPTRRGLQPAEVVGNEHNNALTMHARSSVGTLRAPLGHAETVETYDTAQRRGQRDDFGGASARALPQRRDQQTSDAPLTRTPLRDAVRVARAGTSAVRVSSSDAVARPAHSLPFADTPGRINQPEQVTVSGTDDLIQGELRNPTMPQPARSAASVVIVSGKDAQTMPIPRTNVEQFEQMAARTAQFVLTHRDASLPPTPHVQHGGVASTAARAGLTTFSSDAKATPAPRIDGGFEAAMERDRRLTKFGHDDARGTVRNARGSVTAQPSHFQTSRTLVRDALRRVLGLLPGGMQVAQSARGGTSRTGGDAFSLSHEPRASGPAVPATASFADDDRVASSVDESIQGRSGNPLGAMVQSAVGRRARDTASDSAPRGPPVRAGVERRAIVDQNRTRLSDPVMVSTAARRSAQYSLAPQQPATHERRGIRA